MIDTELARRLERLERDNRRLKAFALATAIVALAAAFAAIRAARPVPNIIKAHEFDLVDSHGKVCAKLGWPAHTPARLAPLVNSLPEDPYRNAPSPELVLDGGTVSINHGDLSADLDSHGLQVLWLHGNGQAAAPSSLRIGSAGMYVDMSGKPSISLNDAQGFETDLGSTSTTNTATGATQQSSAASILMFGNDKDHHVIWQAPTSR